MTASATDTAISVNTTVSNRGKLRNGNPSGDYLKAPRCGARTRAGGGGGQPAMKNGRCRFHGGMSTGARTAAGRARCARARRTHGYYSAGMVSLRREARAHSRRLSGLLGRLPRRRGRPAGQGALPADLAMLARAARAAARRPATAPARPVQPAPAAAPSAPVPAGRGVLPSILRFALAKAGRWLGLRAR